MTKPSGKQWRQKRTSTDPLAAPGAALTWETRDPQCAGSWMLESNGRFKSMMRHRCSRACYFTLAEAMAWAIEHSPSVLRHEPLRAWAADQDVEKVA